jgi:type VI secretion system protein VasI
MKLKTAPIIFFMLTSSVANADSKQDIAKCAANAADAARLVCYDAIAKKLAVDKPVSKVTTGSGRWSVRSSKSPIDDSVNVHLSVQSEESVSSGYNTVRPSLFVRCSENKTNVFLTWDLYLGLDSTRMLTRFDNEQATTDSWSISTDNKAVFARGSDINLAKKMMNHEKLLTQVTPYGESPVMATFSIAGLTEAIKPLRKACKW